MKNDLESLKKSTLEDVGKAGNVETLEQIENELLGRKNGRLTEIMKGLKDLSSEEKKTVGQLANEIKNEIEKALNARRLDLNQEVWSAQCEKEKVDLSAPSLPQKEFGHFHPDTMVQKNLEDFFASMGFMVLDGPELESEYFNFTALNIPADHPARDIQDTFYIKNHLDWVMRTHTSPIQIRAMNKYGAPLRVIVPGRCFRNESTDARHEHTFLQLEGFAIDEHLTLANLKGVFEAVAKFLYGPETKIRLRPKHYPFVEPGVNGEVSCFLCGGEGCRVCKQTGWMEIFGAGMIHPNVLKEGGIDSQKYQGFAFGFGLTRMTMLKYDIDDVRLMQSGDLRFLKQF
jgi:phenylalanyl-tRNA synthetase alpha chain